jgi:hypothetical protein
MLETAQKGQKGARGTRGATVHGWDAVRLVSLVPATGARAASWLEPDGRLPRHMCMTFPSRHRQLAAGYLLLALLSLLAVAACCSAAAWRRGEPGPPR